MRCYCQSQIFSIGIKLLTIISIVCQVKDGLQFICSSSGSKFIVRGLLNQILYEEVPVINFGKKPFDWMTEIQWQKLLVSQDIQEN